MKIYLASQFENKVLLQFVRKFIHENNYDHEIISRWIDNPILTLKDASRMDFQDLQYADLVIAFYPGKVGTSAELGFALAKNIPIIFVSPFKIELDNAELNNIGILPVGKLVNYSDFLENTKSASNKEITEYLDKTCGIIVNDISSCLRMLDTYEHYLKHLDKGEL